MTRLEKLRESCDRHGPEVEMSIRNATVRDLIDLVEALREALFRAGPYVSHRILLVHEVNRVLTRYNEFNVGADDEQA